MQRSVLLAEWISVEARKTSFYEWVPPWRSLRWLFLCLGVHIVAIGLKMATIMILNQTMFHSVVENCLSLVFDQKAIYMITNV